MMRPQLLLLAVLVGAFAVYVAILPNGYECNGFSVRGGDVTSLEPRRYTCEQATTLIRALFRGEGRPIAGAQAVLVRGWHCRQASGAATCTRAHDHRIKARYTLHS